jgi:HD-like signal output (HDOD) protein
MRLPGVALCDARGGLEELANLQGEARAEAALRLANLTIDMERDPAWAAEAIEEGYGLPRVPVASRKHRGGVAPMVTQDLLVAAALLEAIATWTGLSEEGAVGEGTAEAAGMRVVARVRASEQLPEAPAEGLTPVGAEPVPAAEEAVKAEGARPAPSEPPAAPSPAAAPATAPAAAAPSPPTAKPSKPPAPPAPHPEQSQGEPAVPEPPTAPPSPTVASAATAPAAAAPSPPTERPPAVRAQPAPHPQPQGWLRRALRSLRREGGPKPSRPAGHAPSRAARPTPPPEPAVDDADPFAPFARALRVEIPAEPPAPSPADEAAIAELTGRVLATAQAATGELVSFPAVALEILERVRDPRADARSVAGFIARDPALAADVVSVANSAAFRGVSEVESVHEAVARLGLAEVGRVASAVAARKLLDPSGSRGGARAATGLFVRAVAVAMAAAGAALRQRGARSDHVWLGGLLHDVGKALAPQLLVRLAAEPGAHLTSVGRAEINIERVHVEVGQAAIGQWALPAYLRETCAHHHDTAVPAEAVDLHLVRLTSALASLGELAVAARAAREIVQSAGALKMDAPAVRMLATDLKAAEERAKALVR